MLTIKAKIILASTVVFGLTLAIFAFVIYRNAEQTEIAKLDARLETHSEKLEAEIEEQFAEGVFPDMTDLGDVVTDGLPTVWVQIWDSTGHLVVGDSALAHARHGSWIKRGPDDRSIEYLQDEHQTFRCRWQPVEIDEEVPVVLEVVAPLTALHENLSRLKALFMVMVPTSLLLVALASYLIVRTAFRPLAAMARAAQSISANNLDERLSIPSQNDEVRSLAESLNRMIERIEAAFRSQKQFVADASHEIRTPLTIIGAELEFAQKAADPGVIQESINVSLSEMYRLSRMVDGLLLLARVDSAQQGTHLQKFRLDELVVETVQLLRRLAESKKVALDLYVQDAYEVTADRDLVKRAVLNVLENAIKYSPSAATVSIGLCASGDSPEMFLIEIVDRGPGLSEADQARVFERFYRAADARATSDGSGLGLAIAKKLIELNGGTIVMKSAPGQGTHITIELVADPPVANQN